LQSSTEQWEMQFALLSVAVHGCCVTAHLYEEQISIGVIAVTQTSCEPVLQSSTAQRGMQFALLSAAVHFFCVMALLYEEQISISVTALSQTRCEPELQSSTEQWKISLPCSVLQCISVESLHTYMKSKSP